MTSFSEVLVIVVVVIFTEDANMAGLKYGSQVTIKNTCEFALSSYLVRIYLCHICFSLYSLFIPTNLIERLDDNQTLLK